jgi:hypothetical protein
MSKNVLVLTIALGSLSFSMARPPAIGVVTTRGESRVDQVRVAGNGTVFDGSIVETGNTRSELTLKRGGVVILAADSRAKVFADRLVLERGLAEVSESSTYAIEARTLNALPDTNTARLQVGLIGSSKVRVATTNGAADVRSAKGVLVARLNPGYTMEFDPAAAPPEAAQVNGVVVKAGDAYFLTDEATQVTVELRGEGLQNAVGKRVHVSGSVEAGTPAKGATQIVRVSDLKIGTGAGAGTKAPGLASGVSGKTVAIITGVAATGGTIGGLYATGTIGGDDDKAASR